MSAIWTKICGITQIEDAAAVAELGADAVGLNLYPRSPRVVSLDQCQQLVAVLPKAVRRVALFVNPQADEVRQAIDAAGFDLLQFHGDEPESFCQQFGVPFMKAIRVRSAQQARKDMQKFPAAELILLDRFQENVPGGTGKVFDWSIAANLVAGSEQNIVMAGGLNPANVSAAIKQVRPFGVDVSSGVEAAPGKKNLDAVKQFIESSKSV